MAASKNQGRTRNCAVCGKTFPRHELVPGAMVRDAIGDIIRKQCPHWSHEASICRPDLARFRSEYVQSLLESEKGELSALEKEVVESLTRHEILSANVDAEAETGWSLGQRLADRIASFGGSWTFIVIFGVFLIFWIALNSVVLLWHPVDPYPFILLNLLLSCLAAIQAPIIMMSQNRQEARDRLRAENDYQVNLKAELEIRHLHEKLDHLLSHQWERLVEIQEVQLDLLSELNRLK
jgi:uncharacterized membrane protein